MSLDFLSKKLWNFVSKTRVLKNGAYHHAGPDSDDSELREFI